MADISAEQLDSINSWVNTWSQGGTWQRGQPSTAEKGDYTAVGKSSNALTATEKESVRFDAVSSIKEQDASASKSSAVYATNQKVTETATAKDVYSVLEKAVAYWLSSVSSNESSKAVFLAPVSRSEAVTSNHTQSVILDTRAYFGSIAEPKETQSVRADFISDNVSVNDAIERNYANIKAIASLREENESEETEKAVYFSQQSITDVLSPLENQFVKVNFQGIQREQNKSNETSSVRNDSVSGRFEPITATEAQKANFSAPVSVSEIVSPLSAEIANYLTEQHISDALTPFEWQSIKVNFDARSKEPNPSYESSSVRSDAVSRQDEKTPAVTSQSSNFIGLASATENFGDFSEENDSTKVIYFSIRETLGITEQEYAVKSTNTVSSENASADETDIAYKDAKVLTVELSPIQDINIGLADFSVRWRSQADPESLENAKNLITEAMVDSLQADAEAVLWVIFAGILKERSTSEEESTALNAVNKGVREHLYIGESNAVRLDAVAENTEQAEAEETDTNTLYKYAERTDYLYPDEGISGQLDFFAWQDDSADAGEKSETLTRFIASIIESGLLSEKLTAKHYNNSFCIEYLTFGDRCLLLSDTQTVKWLIEKSRNFNVFGSDRTMKTSIGRRLFDVKEEDIRAFKVTGDKTFNV